MDQATELRRAYATLAAELMRVKALGAIFEELARKFHRVVDVLNEVADTAYVHTDRDILRQYEIWLKTGSPRARAILERLGASPLPQRRTPRTVEADAFGPDRRAFPRRRGGERSEVEMSMRLAIVCRPDSGSAL